MLRILKITNPIKNLILFFKKTKFLQKSSLIINKASNIYLVLVNSKTIMKMISKSIYKKIYINKLILILLCKMKIIKILVKRKKWMLTKIMQVKLKKMYWLIIKKHLMIR